MKFNNNFTFDKYISKRHLYLKNTYKIFFIIMENVKKNF